MSNSIWKTPDQKPKGHKTVIEHWLNCYNEHCYDMWKQRPDGGSFDSHTIEWCYLDNLIVQAGKVERLQKAVVLAVDALKEIDWCAQDYAKAQEALAKITALTKGVDND